jgi:hypothetical protein
MAARVANRPTCTSSALGFSPIHRPLFQAPGYRAVCAEDPEELRRARNPTFLKRSHEQDRAVPRVDFLSLTGDVVPKD